MKRSLASGACLVFAFGIASTISAQAARKQPDKPPASGSTAASPGAMGQPAPEMSKLKWMLGTWQCTGKAMASSMGPEHPTEAEVKGEETLGGMWVVFHYREKKTPQNPTPGMVDEYWTYDTAGKMWDRILVDSLGGWATGMARAWEKGKIVWTSDGMSGGQKMKFRDSFTEKNPREIGYVGELAGADGKFTTLWEITCKK